MLDKLAVVVTEIQSNVSLKEAAMKVDSWKCDICERHKKDANHWFRGYKLYAGGVFIIPWDGCPTTEEVEDSEAHLCGADCVMQWVSKNLL